MGRLPALLDGLEQYSPFAGEARSLVRQLMAHPTDSQRQLLIEKWRTSLVGSLLQLQQQIAEAEREKQRQEIEDQLLASRTLADALDPHQISAGGLWDLAQGSWHKRSLVLVKQYARMLQREPLLAEIANLLGRSEQDNRANDSPVPPVQVHELEEVQTDDVPDDLVGIHPASDLMRLLPSEAVMLALPELELEFYRRYLERRLLSYQSRGTLPRQRIMLRTPELGGRQLQQRGPSSSASTPRAPWGIPGGVRQGVVSGAAQGGDGREAGLLPDALLHRGGDPGDHRRHRARQGGAFPLHEFSRRYRSGALPRRP